MLLQLPLSVLSADERHVAVATSTMTTGSVRGLCARGGFEVDCSWRDNRLTQATILSKHGGTFKVRYRDKIITLETKAGQNYSLTAELKL